MYGSTRRETARYNVDDKLKRLDRLFLLEIYLSEE